MDRCIVPFQFLLNLRRTTFWSEELQWWKINTRNKDNFPLISNTLVKNSYTSVCAILCDIILCGPLTCNFILTTVARNWKINFHNENLAKHFTNSFLTCCCTSYVCNIYEKCNYYKIASFIHHINRGACDAIKKYRTNGRHCYLAVGFILLKFKKKIVLFVKTVISQWCRPVIAEYLLINSHLKYLLLGSNLYL